MKSKKLDLAESYLLCMYLNKYEQYGSVIASDSKDSEELKIDRKYVKKKREHLKELGYISYETKKGKPTEIRINPSLLKSLEIKK